MAAELHPVAMARPLFVLKKERPRGEVLERERVMVEREMEARSSWQGWSPTRPAGDKIRWRRSGGACLPGRRRRARRERIDGLGWIEGKQRLALVGWIGSGEKKLVGGRIPRGIWWNGGGGWEDGTSLLKFRVGLYIYSIWVFG